MVTEAFLLFQLLTCLSLIAKRAAAAPKKIQAKNHAAPKKAAKKATKKAGAKKAAKKAAPKKAVKKAAPVKA